MNQIDFKVYTTRAKELEAAIYTQKRLMQLQENIIKEQRPKEPQKVQVLPPPQKPRVEYRRVCLIERGKGMWWFICALAGLIGVLTLIMMSMGELMWGSFWGTLICLAVGAIGIFALVEEVKDYKQRAEDNKSQQRKDKEECEKYPKLLENYRQYVETVDKEYCEAIDRYNASVLEYNQRYDDRMHQHNRVLSILENALNQLYAEDVIFPKYRNLVAITAINEYLMSGRCDKLEGPDGAYNLYEKELRQNIIIAQLSKIIENIEQIRSNQFYLYHELQKANRVIDGILTETYKMNETAKLNAYFAGVIALAETSPKYYCGIVF